MPHCFIKAEKASFSWASASSIFRVSRRREAWGLLPESLWVLWEEPRMLSVGHRVWVDVGTVSGGNAASFTQKHVHRPAPALGTPPEIFGSP